MPKRPAHLMKELKAALVNKDMQGMQAVCLQFSTPKVGTEAALHLLQFEVPADIRAWWLEEACDLPHDGESIMDEALLVVERLRLERERNLE